MAQELSAAAGGDVDIVFTPHLVPMSRGILSTLYARLRPGVDEAAIRKAYAAAYDDEPFVDVLPPGGAPTTGSVVGSNVCRLGLFVDAPRGRLVIVSVIDNLVKGAAGQAVQNMNLMFGLSEVTGLQQLAIYP